VAVSASPRRSRGRRALALLGTCGLLAEVAAYWGACTPLTSRLLLFPSRAELDLGRAQRVMLPHPEGDIETIRARSPGALAAAPRAIVLRFYGNADRADRWVELEAEGFGRTPVEIWGVNYPGFGRSPGRASLAGVARAADVALEAAERRGLPVLAMGTSMGTTAALHLAARGRVRALFLHNPPPLRQLIRGRFGWWNLWLLAGPVAWGVPSSLDSLENARRSTAPMVLLSSEKDDTVPFEYQTAVFDAYAGPKERLVVPGARHNDPAPSDLWRRVRELLARRIP
jgi:uncharacterized protein